MTRPTARTLRLCIWIVAVLFALPAQWIAIKFRASNWPAWVGLILMGALLASTPVDAIRLPRWLSEVLILGGSAGLMWQAGVSTSYGFCAIATVWLIQIALRQMGLSAWWSVLAAWNPVLISAFRY